MSQCDEVIIISSDEETPSPERVQSRRLPQQWYQFRVAYDEWMHCPDYEASAHEILVVAEEVPGPPDRSTWIEDAVRNIYRVISDNEVSEEDLIGLSLTAWLDERQHPVVVIGMRRKAQVKKFDLLKAFEGIERDRPEFLTNGRLVVIKVKHVKRSNQQRAADVARFHQRCLNKKSILSVGATQSPVRNLARAVALSEAYISKEESAEKSKEFVRLKIGKDTYLKKRAGVLLRIVTKAKGEDVDTAMRDFDSYYTKKFTITVFLGLDGRHVLYESWAPPVNGRPQMDIVTDGREFHVVKPDKEAFSCGLNWKYCRLCRVDYRFEAEHECLECCRHCRKVGVCIPHYGISCRACKRDFLSDSCFQRHLEKGRAVRSTCETLKKCKTCLEWYSVEGGRRRHNCSQRFCQNCRDMRSANHTCHASRQSSQVRTPLESRDNGQSLRGAADNSDNAKKRRLDGHTSDHGTTQSTRAEVLPPVTASTSREPVDTFDSTAVARETGSSTSGPSTRSPTASTAAHSRNSAGSLPSFAPPTQTGLPTKLEVAGASANSASDPTGRLPSASTAAHQPDSSWPPGSGTSLRRNTFEDRSNRQASPAAGNRPSEAEQVRGGWQGAEAAGVVPDLPNEGGAIPPIPVRGFYFPHNGKVEFFLPPQ